jgi:type II secretory pathway pseudopilin PulG
MVPILKNLKHESGYTLTRTLIAIAIRGLIAVTILGGLSMTPRTACLYEEQDS